MGVFAVVGLLLALVGGFGLKASRPELERTYVWVLVIGIVLFGIGVAGDTNGF